MLYAAAMRTKTACARASCPAFLSGCHRTLSRRYAARAASASPRALGGSCSASSACRRRSQRRERRKVSRLPRNAARATRQLHAKRPRGVALCCSHVRALQARRGVARLLRCQRPFPRKHHLHPRRVIGDAARSRCAGRPHARALHRLRARKAGGQSLQVCSRTGAQKRGASGQKSARRSGRAQPCRLAWMRCARRWRGCLRSSTPKRCGRCRRVSPRRCHPPLVCAAGSPSALAGRARASGMATEPPARPRALTCGAGWAAAAQKQAYLCSAKCADAGGSEQAYQQWCASCAEAPPARLHPHRNAPRKPSAASRRAPAR